MNECYFKCYFYDEWHDMGATIPCCKREPKNLDNPKTWTINPETDCVNCKYYAPRVLVPDYTSIIMCACLGATDEEVDKFCATFGKYVRDSVDKFRNKNYSE